MVTKYTDGSQIHGFYFLYYFQRRKLTKLEQHKIIFFLTIRIHGTISTNFKYSILASSSSETTHV